MSSLNLKVLIADDERAISDTLGIILKQKGFAATSVYSGEHAVEAARICPPDILISDIVMSGITGIEAAIAIRAICPQCRIILISGASETHELLELAGQAGHTFDVLAKPFPPDELLAHLMA